MSFVTIFSAVGLLQLAPVDRTPVVRAPQDPRVATALSASDTAGAVQLLEEQLATDRRSAAAWFHYGMLRWQQAQGVRSAAFIRDAKAIRHLQLADSALRLAVQLEPANAEFTATLARFNRQAPTTTQRLAGQQQTERALQLARRSGDSALIAWGEAEQGIDAWRRFTSVRNRAHTTGGQRLQVQTNMRWDRARGRSYVNSMVKRLTPPTGGECEFSKLCHGFSLNSVTPEPRTPTIASTPGRSVPRREAREEDAQDVGSTRRPGDAGGRGSSPAVSGALWHFGTERLADRPRAGDHRGR